MRELAVSKKMEEVGMAKLNKNREQVSENTGKTLLYDLPVCARVTRDGSHLIYNVTATDTGWMGNYINLGQFTDRQGNAL